jgi:phosphatidylglycerol:prolipoprotein diacylglycerol transferase
MWPVLYQPPGSSGFSVNSYGILILAAFCCAFVLANVRSRQAGISMERLVPMYGAAAVGGLLGARVLYVLAVEPASLLTRPWSLFGCSGFAFYGGLLGGALAVVATANRLGLPGWKVADVLGPPVALGLGIGRLGCFFAGCCHGAPSPHTADAVALLPEGALLGQIWLEHGFPWIALEFHPGGVGRILDVPLYPTQLWSAAVGVGVALFLSLLWKKRPFDGFLFGLMLIVEPPLRFFVEAFRGDHRGYLFTWSADPALAARFPGMSRAGDQLVTDGASAVMGVTTSQALGVALMVVGVGILVARRGTGVAPEVPLVDDDDPL